MFRVLFIVCSVFISHLVSIHANEQQEVASSEDCILSVTSKVYVNPERIFCEDEKHYLQIAEKESVLLPNLQYDHKGYFVELATASQVDDLMVQVRSVGALGKCPLCDRGGYFAGICGNKDCPGVENRRKYEEGRKQKDEEYKKRKDEEAEKKKKERAKR